jgi:hypothetical protein
MGNTIIIGHRELRTEVSMISKQDRYGCMIYVHMPGYVPYCMIVGSTVIITHILKNTYLPIVDLFYGLPSYIHTYIHTCIHTHTYHPFNVLPSSFHHTNKWLIVPYNTLQYHSARKISSFSFGDVKTCDDLYHRSALSIQWYTIYTSN